MTCYMLYVWVSVTLLSMATDCELLCACSSQAWRQWGVGSMIPRSYQTPAQGTVAPLAGNGPTAAPDLSSQGLADLGEPGCAGITFG